MKDELRDLLLGVWFNLPRTYESVDSYEFYADRIMGETRHNYQRDQQMRKGKFEIKFKNCTLGIIETKPHRKLILYKQYGKFVFYRNLLEDVALEVAPGLRIERQNGR